jgi:poly(hydroxyalkanoate) depolymerase family esterase
MTSQKIVREATRLTRAGQLVEATALLQRMLRGEAVHDSSGNHASEQSARLEPPTIDLTASVVEKASPEAARTRSTLMQPKSPVWLGSLKDSAELRLRAPSRRAPPSAADIAPNGTKFNEGIFRSAAGSRTYKLFIPSRYHGKPLPLIVMLHGCTQSPDDFAAGTRMNFLADEHDCFVVYPEQTSGANQSKCWNWFRTTHQRRDGGEPSLIAGITRQVMRDYQIDSKRVYVGGLSAGGAAAAIMGAAYADLYAAAGIHSGLACGAASDLPSALIAMRQGGRSDATVDTTLSIPTIVFHGDRDGTVSPVNGDQIIQQLGGATATEMRVLRERVPNGHAYTRTILTDAAGRAISEHWNIHGSGHAWSGGSPAGSYTDSRGPNATREMLRFFLAHSRPG